MSVASLLSDLPAGSRILVVRLRSIGDIILLTPALRLLNNWRPDLRVSVVVEHRFRSLLAANPTVEEVLEPGDGTGWNKLTSRLRAARELRRRKFVLCVNLHGGPTSRFLTRTCGAGRKVGFAHYRSPALYDVLVPDARTILGKESIHTAEHQASAFFHLGLPHNAIPRAELYFTSEDAAWWMGKRKGLGILPGQDYAILHPTALYKTKEWSPGKFARLGEYLMNSKGFVPVYSCGPGESAVLDAIEHSTGPRIHRLEGASLSQFAAALAGAQIFIGNDSGPAHMAAALSRPGVVIFGSSSSLIWGPWPRQACDVPVRIVQNPYECNPCPGDRCYRFERPECILSVSFEQVREAVDAVLARPENHSQERPSKLPERCSQPEKS
jgi:heptosyltransferase-3